MRERHIIPVVIVLACSLTCIGMVFHSRQQAGTELRVRDGSQDTLMHLGALAKISFENMKTGQQVLLPNDSPPSFKLVIFLSAADCSACLSQIPLWRPLLADSSHKQVSGYLLFVDSSESEAKQAESVYGSGFTVLRDTSGAVPKTVGLPPRTPVTVLMDEHFKVRIAQGATNNFDAEQAFVKAVSDITGGL